MIKTIESTVFINHYHPRDHFIGEVLLIAHGIPQSFGQFGERRTNQIVAQVQFDLFERQLSRNVNIDVRSRGRRRGRFGRANVCGTRFICSMCGKRRVDPDRSAQTRAINFLAPFFFTVLSLPSHLYHDRSGPFRNNHPDKTAFHTTPLYILSVYWVEQTFSEQSCRHHPGDLKKWLRVFFGNSAVGSNIPGPFCVPSPFQGRS